MNAISKKKKGKRIMIPLLVICAIILFVVGFNMLFRPLKKEIKLTGNYEPVYQDYWLTKGESEIQVRAWYPKEYSEDGSAKVMVFSHGSCGTIDNNVSLYKELASNGYVVLAPAHPGSASVMTKSDGSKVRVSSEFIKEMTSVNPNGDAEKAYQIFQKWMKERMEDLNLVMDDFKTKCQNPKTEFEHISDASRFIVTGHSLGGSAAYAMARTRTDISSCIALESPCMYDIKGVSDGKFIFDDSPYNVPLLNIYTDSSYPHLKEWMQYKNNEMLLTAKNSISLYYKGVGHMGICDLSLASPILAAILGGKFPRVDAVTQLTQLNTDVMAFINLHG